MQHDPTLDYRQHPEAYFIGRGETGVLRVEPYKSELLLHWRFKTPDVAQQSATALLARYDEYKAASDFVGMDMARKFLQMGYTRSRRYANHRGGRKYDPDTGAIKPRSEEDPEKAASARIFKQALEQVKQDPDYQAMKTTHQARHRRYRGA